MQEQDRSNSFHAQWMTRLDRVLPAPCAVLGLMTALSSDRPWASGSLVAFYVLANLGLSALARSGIGIGYFGGARNLLSVACFTLLGWISGPESWAWSLTVIALFARSFSRSSWRRLIAQHSIIAGAALGAWLGGRTPMETLAIGGILASIAYLVSGLSKALYSTWLSAQVNAEALEERNQALQSALATRQVFLATMSHEVRTPLNGVLGMAELLSGTPLALDQRCMLETIRDSGQGLLQVLNDVLDTAKLDAGKISLETLPFNPAQLAGSVCRLLGAKGKDTPVVVRVEVDPSVPSTIAGDPTRLRQVLLNLVGNAYKFTEEGEVVVRLTWAEDTLVVSVRDTGIGISEQARAQIFEPFSQAESGTTRQYGGTGLGLTISRRLVDLMGGTLSLESTLGQGSNFTVHLPALASTPLPMSASLATGGRLPELVLVVEDNPVNLLVTSRMLETIGCAYLTATNGSQALKVVAEHPIDLILMDCRMPVMDGFEATRQLRAQALFLPILALTAGVTEEEQRACDEAGMDGVLPKPLTLEALREALERQTNPERISA